MVMTPSQLHQVLRGIEPAGEWVFDGYHDADPVELAWLRAESEARDAYEHWRRDPSRASYAMYRACADRADAAQDALALSKGQP